MSKLYKLKDAQDLIKCTKYTCSSLDLMDWWIFINKLFDLGCTIDKFAIPVRSPYIYIDQDLVISYGSAEDKVQWNNSEFKLMNAYDIIDIVLNMNSDKPKSDLKLFRERVEYLISKNIDYFKCKLNIFDECINDDFSKFNLGDYVLIKYYGLTNITYEFYRKDKFIGNKLEMTVIKIQVPNKDNKHFTDLLDTSYRMTVGTITSSMELTRHDNAVIKKIPKRIFNKLLSIHENKLKQLDKVRIDTRNEIISTLRKSEILS